MSNIARPPRRLIQGKGPITGALVKMLDEKVPNDPRRRTHAEVIAGMLIRKALKGDLQAIKEIADRVEGKVLEASHHELAQPVDLRVVFEKRKTGNQERGIESPHPPGGHIESA
jgi:hypothetical protein